MGNSHLPLFFSDGLFSQSGVERQITLRKSFAFELFRAKDLSPHISYKNINDWDRRGLLVGSSQEGKWRKFNFLEYCWLLCVNEFRLNGYSYTTIQKIRDELNRELSLQEITQDLEILKTMEFLLKENHDSVSQKTQGSLGRNFLIPFFEASFNFNYLFLLILEALDSKRHISVMCTPYGEVAPISDYSSDKFLNEPVVKRIRTGSHFRLSITKILERFIDSENISVLNRDLKLLDKNEAMILELIRKRDFSMIKLNLNRNGDPASIEVTKEEELKQIGNIQEIILHKGYQDISLKTQKGQVVLCRNTTKIKLS